MELLVEVKSAEQFTHVNGEPYPNTTTLLNAMKRNRVVVIIGEHGYRYGSCLQHTSSKGELICYNEWLRREACKE